MKLKDYLSRKAFKRKLSKLSLSKRPDMVESSFVEYQSEPRAIYSKDDFFLPTPIRGDEVEMRMKYPGRGKCDMLTQSMFADLSSTGYHSGDSDTSLSSEIGCQTPVHGAHTADGDNQLLCIPNGAISTQKLDHYSSIIHTSPEDDFSPVDGSISMPTCARMHTFCNTQDRRFSSLPSIESFSSPLLPEIKVEQYHSLPTSMVQSCYVSCSESGMCSSAEISRINCMQRSRSRIRTNPWLRLPITTEPQFCGRNCAESSLSKKKDQPRLSRFFSEVSFIDIINTWNFYRKWTSTLKCEL